MKDHSCAIVGLGGMGNWHRELICGQGNWNNHDCGPIEHLSLAGSFDISEERQQFARSVGVHAYERFTDLLADPKVDLVICATPNDAHKQVVIEALQAGKHVVCEKPAALSSAEFAQMVDAAKLCGRLLTVHQNRRWDEDYLTIKKLYEEKTLGEMFRIESRVQGCRGIPGDWRQDPMRGGGMVLDWGVHLLDQALMMIPEKVRTVYATFTNITNELVEDGFTVELTFESGLKFIVEVGTSNFVSLPRWYALSRDGTAVIEDWRYAGKMVRITNWDKNDAVPIRTAAGLTKTMAPRTDDTIATQALPLVSADIRDYYRNVMAAIDGMESAIVTLPQVMRVMKLMEAVFDSARIGQVVPFEG